jgi:hypothetical protein
MAYERYIKWVSRAEMDTMAEWCHNNIGTGRKWNILVDDEYKWGCDFLLGNVFFYFNSEDDLLAFALAWG